MMIDLEQVPDGISHINDVDVRLVYWYLDKCVGIYFAVTPTICGIIVVVLNPAKKETPHSFKGHQLGNKLLYRLVIYIGLWVTFLALI